MNSSITNSKKRIKESLEGNFEYHHIALAKSDAFLRKHDSERLPMYILFVDLVGSTKMSEELDPNSLNVIIRTFSQEMSYVIEDYGGYVLKFVGDAVLAYFPDNKKDNQADTIIKCTENMHILTDQMINPVLDEEGFPKLQIKTTIDYGDCSIVRYGSNKKRAHIDLIGLTINLASKMQNYTKPNQTTIGKFVFTRLGSKIKKSFKKKQTDNKSWIFHQLNTKSPYTIYQNN